MKTKIFNAALFAVLAFMAVSAKAFAQIEPPTPPANVRLNRNLDDKEYRQQMENLRTKMAGLNKEMAALSVKHGKEIRAAINKSRNKLSTELKDFSKDFSGSFKDLAPDIGNSFKGLNNITINSNDDEYKKKVASGQVTEKIKNFSKTYSVDADDLLQIDNKFGKVTVNTWSRKEFKVDVQMKFGSEDADAVNDMINGSSVRESKVGSTVSFKTVLYQNEGNSGRNQHIEINYTVYMPAGNPVDITNKFGGVTLPDLSGKALLRVSYGSLTAQQLLNKDNDVKVRFGDANIVTFNGGKLDVGYGKLKAGTVNNVNANISFGSFNVDKLKNSVDVNIKYGDGFNIGAIDRSVRNLNINASFTKVNLDFSQSESFNFDITTKFGSFNYDDDRVKITSKSPDDEERGWSSTKSYKGYIGKTNTDGKIVINANYTGVRFK